AIFHAGVPAWAVRREGVVVGALWRNAQQERCDFYGAGGTDGQTVAVSYAVRIPTGIRSPRSGAQLREALAFETPAFALRGRPGSARRGRRGGGFPRLSPRVSVALGDAITPAERAGPEDRAPLVLGFYRPPTAALRVGARPGARLRFPPQRPLGVHGMTALE